MTEMTRVIIAGKDPTKKLNENGIKQKHFIVPTDAHCYKIIEMLKQFKIITLPPTFTQEPSSGSSPVLS
jgi:hypothetical protein